MEIAGRAGGLVPANALANKDLVMCGGVAGASSLVAQLLTAQICEALIQRGIDPPVYRSANVEGGDAHNDALLARYAGRLKVHEP
jgi:uncharacterized phosphosugar-binding protein